eukprot:3073990-Amphidinium_carterae.1
MPYPLLSLVVSACNCYALQVGKSCPTCLLKPRECPLKLYKVQSRTTWLLQHLNYAGTTKETQHYDHCCSSHSSHSSFAAQNDATLIEDLLDEEQGSLDTSDMTLVNKRVMPLLKYCGWLLQSDPQGTKVAEVDCGSYLYTSELLLLEMLQLSSGRSSMAWGSYTLVCY